jgi:hypothetical protein
MPTVEQYNNVVTAADAWLKARLDLVTSPTHREPLKGGGTIVLFDDPDVLKRLSEAESKLADAVLKLKLGDTP